MQKQNRDRSRHCKGETTTVTTAATASAHARVAILKKLLCPTCRRRSSARSLSENIAFQNINVGGNAHNENSSIAKAPLSTEVSRRIPGTRSCCKRRARITQHSITWSSGDSHELLRRRWEGAASAPVYSPRRQFFPCFEQLNRSIFLDNELTD